MTDLIISGVLADRIKNVARHQDRPVEALLSDIIAPYETVDSTNDSAADSAPGATLRDEDIDVPADITKPQEYRDGIRLMRPFLYQRAREYWAKVGDHERLALTNRELDQQFWCIGPEDIPYLKADQATVTLPPDPLDALIGIITDGPTDLSSTVRETMDAHYRHELERHDRGYID